LRRAAVAGSWYPSHPAALERQVDEYLDAARTPPVAGVRAIVAPHAGLMYSGPVAAHAYGLLRGNDADVAVLVGPSHYVSFEGVSIYERGAFETPFGPVPVAEECAASLKSASRLVKALPAAHAREHSLEMQLPFLARVLPGVAIVPLVMGHQTRQTAYDLGDAIAATLQGRRAILIASTDLSHYYDARTASALDDKVMQRLDRFDADGLMDLLETFPGHACGGGPTVAVMRAAKALGAHEARILKYADSGDVSGEKDAVVGYVAAAFGEFSRET
jgi:AmmeMemoRadiSam system protein B